jgi:hypothetical protein
LCFQVWTRPSDKFWKESADESPCVIWHEHMVQFWCNRGHDNVSVIWNGERVVRDVTRMLRVDGLSNVTCIALVPRKGRCMTVPLYNYYFPRAQSCCPLLNIICHNYQHVPTTGIMVIISSLVFYLLRLAQAWASKASGKTSISYKLSKTSHFF